MTDSTFNNDPTNMVPQISNVSVLSALSPTRLLIHGDYPKAKLLTTHCIYVPCSKTRGLLSFCTL